MMLFVFVEPGRNPAAVFSDAGRQNIFNWLQPKHKELQKVLSMYRCLDCPCDAQQVKCV